MTTLIIGGSSGLGLEVAREFSSKGKVIVTGRTDPEVDFAEFRHLELTGKDLPSRITKLINGLPEVRRQGR